MRLDDPSVMLALDMVTLQQPSVVRTAARPDSTLQRPPLVDSVEKELSHPEQLVSRVAEPAALVSESVGTKTIKLYEGPPTVVLGQRVKHAPQASGASVLIRDFLTSLRLEEYLSVLSGLGVDRIEVCVCTPSP
jgi:hypothetical protein